jgi:predicted aspartyl protease
MGSKQVFILLLLLVSQALFAQESIPVASIPFEFRNDQIVVKLKINDSDRVLNMLFDTGADGVGMKKEVADAIGLKESRKQQTQVVGAITEIVISSGNTLRFDTLQIKNQNIGIFPNYKDDLDGLFGANLLRNYITHIDFDNSVINLYRFGPITYPEGGCKIPLDYKTGLPGIEAKVKLNSGKEILAHLHFDTGANYPLIFFGPSVKKNELEKDFKVQFRSTTVSLGHSTPTLNGIFDWLALGNYRVPHFTGTLQEYDAQSGNWGHDTDGSLGIDIISKFNCFINLPAKEFYILPNKSYDYPFDFWFGNIQFGLSNSNIVVKHIIRNGSDQELQIREKDLIVSMNDKTPADFKNKDTMMQLEKEYKTGEIELIVNRNDLEFKTSITGK